MKYFLSLMIATILTIKVSAEESEIAPQLITDTAITNNTEKTEEIENPAYKTTYIRLGGKVLPTVEKHYVAAPSFTFGWLYREGVSAVDISIDFSMLKQEKEDIKREAYSYTLPKVLYLRFLNPNEAQGGAYFGIGGSFYSLDTSKRTKIVREESDDNYYYYDKVSNRFVGLAANSAAGYNAKLGEHIQAFGQVGVGMPVFAISKKGENVHMPFFEMRVGLGY